MNHDVSTMFAGLATFLAMVVNTVFGIDGAVAFAALAGSLFSLRFCDKKGILAVVIHVGLSSIAACYLTLVGLYFMKEFPAIAMAAGMGLVALLIVDWIGSVASAILAKIKLQFFRMIERW